MKRSQWIVLGIAFIGIAIGSYSMLQPAYGNLSYSIIEDEKIYPIWFAVSSLYILIALISGTLSITCFINAWLENKTKGDFK
jgi:hypothetical protein